MANRLHELKQTKSNWQARGIVSGTKGNRFYKSGTTKNGGTWNTLEFGLTINTGKTIYIKLSGFTKDEVYYYKRGENGEKGTTKKVAWAKRTKSPGDGFRLMGINISTGKDDDGKNVNEVMVEYDAVEYLAKNLSDGDSIFAKGTIEFSSYTDRNGSTARSVELVPSQISYTQKAIDFDADDFEEEALFETDFVYTDIEKETDIDGKATGGFVVSGYSVGYNTIEPVSFIIRADHAKLANNLRKKMKPYYMIHMFGRIEVIIDMDVVESDDDSGWGETSKMERINKPVKREYVIFRADPNSIDEEEYSEKSVSDALKAIKNAKTAEQNFSGKTNDDTSAPWDDDSDDDEEEDW